MLVNLFAVGEVVCGCAVVVEPVGARLAVYVTLVGFGTLALAIAGVAVAGEDDPFVSVFAFASLKNQF